MYVCMYVYFLSAAFIGVINDDDDDDDGILSQIFISFIQVQLFVFSQVFKHQNPHFPEILPNVASYC